MTHSTITTYTIGFLLSVGLTLIAFLIAPSLGSFAVPCIVATALTQLGVQLVFFLHLGREQDAEWSVGIFSFAAVIIGILVIGTLWIMHNLAHLHIHTPVGTELYEHGVIAPQNELH
jgi:cytochrome o ubiquinol oxidase operon protein cyoD